MESIKPFADDTAALSIGELKIENGQDRIALYGNLDLTRDKQGLKQARELKAIVDDILRVLEADRSLPDAVGVPATSQHVKNPFV